jgi:uncharacterized protein (TIGR02246 family)
MTIASAAPRFVMTAVAAVSLLTAGAAGATDADPADIAAVSLAWKKAYNAADVSAVADLYADDAVLSAPGQRAVIGKAAIREYFVATIAQFAAAGLVVHDAPMGDIVTSCDLAWQWQTYEVVDKSGTTVDSGRLVTLLRRENGKWLIAGDTWNSDRPAAPAATP